MAGAGADATIERSGCHRRGIVTRENHALPLEEHQDWSGANPLPGSALMIDDVSPSDDSSLRQRIEAVLDEQVRPGLRADGGDVEVVGIDADKIVQVRMVGACQGCPSAIMTLTFGIESTLKSQIPEIRFLEAVP
jgi:Fe-S cluster biogenesis protein NfuA